MSSYKSIDEMQNDKINSVLIKVEALQKEYEVSLQQYQEAVNNFITNLQNVESNPCANYRGDSTGISQKCYEKIWADQGCTNLQSVNAYSDWAKAQTLDTLVNDSFLWATLTSDTHRKGCYGESTNYTTNTSPTYPNTNIFSALKERTWWGTTGLKEGTVSTQQECEDMCANTTQCSGATFNPVKRYCWTRSGDSAITAGKDDDYALITQQKESLSTMKYLNQRLLDLNQEITNELQNINPQVEQQYDEKNTKQQQLSSSYNSLLEQKIALDKELQEYYSIGEEENNQSIFVNQQSFSYRFWLLITCLILLFMIYQLYGAESPPVSNIIWLLIIIVLIILTYTLSSPSGFVMFFVFLLVIFLIKSRN